MRDMGDLLTKVMPFAPSCPELFAVEKIRDAARKFCQRTRVWRQKSDYPMTTALCKALVPAPGGQIFEIESAAFDDKNLTPIDVAWLDRNREGWRTDDTEAAPDWITQTEFETVSIYPRSEGTLALTVFLMPSPTTTRLADFLVDRYGEEISHGAIGEMLVTPQRDFSNPQLGASYITRFEGHLDRLSQAGKKGQQRAPRRSQGHWF